MVNDVFYIQFSRFFCAVDEKAECHGQYCIVVDAGEINDLEADLNIRQFFRSVIDDVIFRQANLITSLFVTVSKLIHNYLPEDPLSDHFRKRFLPPN